MADAFGRTDGGAIIGRASERRLLASYLKAGTGAGVTVLVAGEAGIGKSRLVTELTVEADAVGVPCVLAHCYEEDYNRPFAAVLELLHRLAALTRDPGARAADAELHAYLSSPGRPDTHTAAWDQHRVGAAVIERVGAVARQSGRLLLVVEDLHWCDEASLDVLLRLVRRTAQSPLLLVLTARVDEANVPLQALLATLAREHLVVEVSLGPLGPDQTAELVRSVLALPRLPPRAFTLAIHEVTDGNPFFIEAVLASFAGQGDDANASMQGFAGFDRRALPRTVQFAMQRRLDRLSLDARRLLSQAAVIGRRFDFGLLRSLTGLVEAEQIELLREAVSARLLVELSADEFEFRHALIREALYADLLVRERRGAHARLAQLLATADEERWAERSFHSYEAEDWPAAADVARRAGELALKRFAPAAALAEFTRAHTARQRMGLAVDPVLARQRGAAFESLGNFEGARGDYDAALTAADASGSRGEMVEALLALGMLWAARDYEQSRSHYERALALAEEEGEPRLLVRALNALGNWYVNAEEPRAAWPMHERALALAESLNSDALVLESLDLLGLASYLGTRYADVAPLYERALALARRLDERRALASMLCTFGSLPMAPEFEVVWAPGHIDDAISAINEGLRHARATGWSGGEAFARIQLATALSVSGRYAEAVAELSAAEAIAEGIGHEQWRVGTLVVAAHVYASLGDWPLAIANAERAREQARGIGSRYWDAVSLGMYAHVLVAAGRGEEALRALPAEVPEPTTTARRWVVLNHAAALLAAGEGERAAATIGGLLPPDPGHVIPVVWQLQGEALASLGRHDQAVALIERSALVAEEHGLMPRAWRARAALGRVWRAAGDPAAAQRQYERARSTAEALTTGVDARWLDTYRGAVDSATPGAARGSRARGPAGLSPREIEVLALVVRGLSNQEIAETLVVSRRTVETHIGNIFGKTGSTTRAQTVAWAMEHDLVPGVRVDRERSV